MKRAVAFALALLISVSFGAQTFAASYTSDDKFYNGNDILFYSSTYSSTCTSNGAAGAKTSDSGNAAEVYNYFVGKGMSSIAAAAIVGNFKQESSLNPRITNGIGAYGLAQWLNDRKTTLFSRDGYSTLQGQLDYVWWEFHNYSAGQAGYKILQEYTGSDASALAISFGQAYEGYGQGEQGSRGTYAADIYKQYGAVAGGVTTGLSGNCNNTGAGNFVYYSQTDPKWANISYGSGTIGPDGCAPTSLAMIVATFFDSTATPETIAQIGAANGSYTAKDGTIHLQLLGPVAKKYGFKYTDLKDASMDTLVNYVKSGGLIYLAGAGAPPFTKGGHVVVMRGVTSDGKIIIADPYRGESDTYSPAVIQAGKGSTYGIKPL